MTKIGFIYELFRYVSVGLTKVTLETNDFIYGFDFDEDNMFIGQDYFRTINEGLIDFKIKYSDMKAIRGYKE